MFLRNIKAFVWVAVLLLGTNANAAAVIQKGKITNPRVAAQRLYNAWKMKSRKAGLKVASSEAVSKLFSTKWRPMQFRGCQNTGGSFECIYRDAKLDLDVAMVVEGGASAGYHVESVSFSSEAARLPAFRPQLDGPVTTILRTGARGAVDSQSTDAPNNKYLGRLKLKG